LLVVAALLAISASQLFVSGRGILAALLLGQVILIVLWFLPGGARRAL
jgi:hypothetical protein